MGDAHSLKAPRRGLAFSKPKSPTPARIKFGPHAGSPKKTGRRESPYPRVFLGKVSMAVPYGGRVLSPKPEPVRSALAGAPHAWRGTNVSQARRVTQDRFRQGLSSEESDLVILRSDST